ncbi:hypothetical protein SFUMM280S_05967 [Streptomyces fumanus]
MNDFIRPFDVEKAPLLRIGLVSVSVNVHYLLIDMHHIISDGASVGILIEEALGKPEEPKKKRSVPTLIKP